MDIVVSFIVLVLAVMWIYARGFDHGVEETEKRWSDAVSKCDWDRKYGG